MFCKKVEMKTRQQVNFQNVNIRQLLLDESPKVRVQRVQGHRRRRQDIEERQNAHALASPSPRALAPTPSLPPSPLRVSTSSPLRVSPSPPPRASPSPPLKPARENNNNDNLQVLSEVASAEYSSRVPEEFKSRFLVLDTESFNLHTDGDGASQLLPLQIAWSVYEWHPEQLSLKCVQRASWYVREVLRDANFRAQLYDISAACLQRHEDNSFVASAEEDDNVKFNSISGARDILVAMRDAIGELQVSTLVAYNVSWDFLALRNMVELWAHDVPDFDANCDNPFNPMSLFYLDLMHVTVTKYGQQLVAQGIYDGTIHRVIPASRSASSDDSDENSDSREGKIVLRRNTRYSKSIYSAEYVLNHFFSVKQMHLADADVEHEALLLEKCLQDFGVSGVEYNMCYPQTNCYQRMLHWANERFADLQPIDVGENEEGKIPAPKKRLRKRNVTSSSEDLTVCLFDDSEH